MTTQELVLHDERIRVACECGRKYKLRSEHAGRSLRCRRCLTRLRVPGGSGRAGAVSGRSRAAILLEFGIDPDAAESRFWSGELRREARQPAALELEPTVTVRDRAQATETAGNAIDACMTSETLSKAALLCAFLILGLTGFMHTIFAAPIPLASMLAFLAAVPAAVGVHDRLARAAYRPQDMEAAAQATTA